MAGRPSTKLEVNLNKIDESLKKRLSRSLLSDKDRKKSRERARIEMASSRKNGFLRRRKYKQRTKRDPNKITIWNSPTATE